MDFDELRTELSDRGFSDLSTTRLGRYINSAMHELDRTALWPWREKSVTGTSPLSVTDLGVIEAVTNETLDYPLVGRQWRDLLDGYGDLSTTGTPIYYYVAWPSGTPVVATYPSSSDTLGVQYWKVETDLSSDSDTPGAPSEAQYLIVDLAVRRAAKDKGDWDQYRAVKEEVAEQLDALLFQYQPGQSDAQPYIVQGWGEDS